MIWPQTQFELRQTVQLPKDWFDFGELTTGWPRDSIVDRGNAGFKLAQVQSGVAIKSILIDDAGVAEPPTFYVWPTPRSQHWAELIHAILVPPALMLGMTVYETWQWAMGSPPVSGTLTEIIVMTGLMFIHLFIAWLWTRHACRHRHLNTEERRSWQWAACLLGIAVPIMVYCFHERVAVEDCGQCGTPVRVDELACPECDETHAKTPPRGIEIFRTVNVSTEELRV